MLMAELFPPGTTLRSSKEALDVEIFGHAPGALDGEDAYVCTFIRDGEDAGEDLMPVSRAHDEAEFARVEPPSSSPAAEPEEEWWPDGASGGGGGGARDPPSGAAQDDAPISPFRETTLEVPREDDAPERGDPDVWGEGPPPLPASPASPASAPPRSKPRGEPPKGRGDDAFNPGARLCDAKTKPHEVNFIVEVVSYDARKDRYRCVFRDGKGKKLDEDVVKGRRLHDPSAFRQIGAGQKRVATDGESNNRKSSNRTKSSASDGRPTRNGRNGRVAPAPANGTTRGGSRTTTTRGRTPGEGANGATGGRDWRRNLPKFARRCLGAADDDAGGDDRRSDGSTPANRSMVTALERLEALADGAVEDAGERIRLLDQLADMTSKASCGEHDWTRKTASGWNVFQIAAREGCGDALDNLHTNCVKRGVSTVAQVNRGKWRQPENAVTMDWLVDQKSPDGRNMLHLIAAGWDKLEDHDQPEVASFAKGIINAMTPKQIRRQAPVHGTCVHACAEAGAGAFFRFLLEHGGGDCTQVRCAPDPEPANKPAKTAMERFRKMFFAAAPGVKPRAKESDAKTPLEAARAALDGLEAEETNLVAALKGEARREAAEDGMTSGAPSPVGFKPTGDAARRLERQVASMQRKLAGLRKCVDELVAHERIFLRSDTKKEAARTRAEADADEPPHEAQTTGFLGRPISASDWTEDADGHVHRTARPTAEGGG